MNPELWEILVPTAYPDGRPISKSDHQIWDAKIHAITGGLTLHSVLRGQWLNKEEAILCEERMIPVHVACTRNQLNEILKITKDYYKQNQVMAVKISSEVIFYE